MLARASSCTCSEAEMADAKRRRLFDEGAALLDRLEPALGIEAASISAEVVNVCNVLAMILRNA